MYMYFDFDFITWRKISIIKIYQFVISLILSITDAWLISSLLLMDPEMKGSLRTSAPLKLPPSWIFPRYLSWVIELNDKSIDVMLHCVLVTQIWTTWGKKWLKKNYSLDVLWNSIKAIFRIMAYCWRDTLNYLVSIRVRILTGDIWLGKLFCYITVGPLENWLNDWFWWHVNPSGIILYQDVR